MARSGLLKVIKVGTNLVRMTRLGSLWTMVGSDLVKVTRS